MSRQPEALHELVAQARKILREAYSLDRDTKKSLDGLVPEYIRAVRRALVNHFNDLSTSEMLLQVLGSPTAASAAHVMLRGINPLARKIVDRIDALTDEDNRVAIERIMVNTLRSLCKDTFGVAPSAKTTSNLLRMAHKGKALTRTQMKALGADIPAETKKMWDAHWKAQGNNVLYDALESYAETSKAFEFALELDRDFVYQFLRERFPDLDYAYDEFEAAAEYLRKQGRKSYHK